MGRAALFGEIGYALLLLRVTSRLRMWLAGVLQILLGEVELRLSCSWLLV